LMIDTRFGTRPLQSGDSLAMALTAWSRIAKPYQ